MKLEEGKRKSASVAMVKANIAAVIAEILEKYRSQIMKEVDALIVDILDSFTQTPTTSVGKTSHHSNQGHERYLDETFDGSKGSSSPKNKSTSLYLKKAMSAAGIETLVDPSSNIDNFNENACVVEITVNSDDSETVWLADGLPLNLDDEESQNDPVGKTKFLQEIPTGNIIIEPDVPELMCFDDDAKPFITPDHTYQFFADAIKQADHNDINAEIVVDSTKCKVQRRRRQLSPKNTSTEKRIDETDTETSAMPSSIDEIKKNPVKRATSRLRDQKKSPTGERPTWLSLQTTPATLFQCKLCDKQYKYNSELKIHQLTHSAKGQFKCNFCGKGFNHPANKRTHERLHDPSKRFQCETCGRTYTQKGNLKFHIVRWHGDKMQNMPRFRCEFCGRRYHQNRSYKRHLPRCEKRDFDFQCEISLQKINANLLAQKQKSAVTFSEASREFSYSELSS